MIRFPLFTLKIAVVRLRESRIYICRGRRRRDLSRPWRLVLSIVIISMFLSCSPADPDQAFEKHADDFIEDYLQMYPETATRLGDHRYDHRLNDYSLAGVREAVNLNDKYLVKLKKIDPANLSDVNRIDYQILIEKIEKSLFRLTVLKEHEWNPLIYNPGGAIYNLIARDSAPLKERLLNIQSRMENIPGMLNHARTNLYNPPKIFTETAVRRIKGTVTLLQDELTEFIIQVPEIEANFYPVRNLAVTSLQEYIAWLENDLLPRSQGDFRLGEEKFRQKLRYTLESDISLEEILERAQKDLVTTQDEIYLTALEIYRRDHPKVKASDDLQNKKKLTQKVLDKLADSHPNNETIVSCIEKCLQETREFTIAQDFVTVPDEPISIIVMPEFQRGVASAYCDSPGPLEKDKQTFFAISPAPADWPEERVISTYREDNDYMLHDLTIHEAMPGHYLQLAHGNKFRAPTMIRAIFKSGTFIEGWATYAEQLMVEHGYGGLEVKMQQLKMHLRVVVNAIIDQKIHTAGMTEQEAIDLMIDEGFQEEGEAAGKWRRACLTSTQLTTYFVGNLEMNEIRRSYEEGNEGKIDLKKFHDRVLSYGSPPFKHLRELLNLN